MKVFSILIMALCTVPFVQAQDIDISSKSAKVRIGDVDISITRPPFMQGDWELSMTGSLGSVKSENSYPNLYYPTVESSLQYVFLSFSTGYFLLDHFSIEPEISLLAIENSKPAQSILFNLSYTYQVGNSNTALFLRGGYGLGNGLTYQIGTVIQTRYSTDFDFKIINAGVGVKYLVAQGAALRIELNYRQQKYSEKRSDGPESSITTETKDSIIHLCFGFSVLL
jgi:hypothetical protein